MLDWLVQPRRQKTPARHARRRRAAERLLPAARQYLGGGVDSDPFSLYPCTRMHGADFEAEFHSSGQAGDPLHI